MLEPIKCTWKAKGVSICSDGWSNAQKKLIIKFMMVTESGPMFLNVISAEGHAKNKYYITAKLMDYIRRLGIKMCKLLIMHRHASRWVQP